MLFTFNLYAYYTINSSASCTRRLIFSIQTPLAMDMWAWSRQEAVRNLGIQMACGALVGVTCFGLVGPLAKRFDDRKLLIFVGLIPLIFAKAIMIPMSNEKPLYIDPQGIF